jgi:hypothetical protein
MSNGLALDELESLLDRPFVFHQRPKPVPGVLRPAWRIPTILLLIKKCWGGKASLEQLHVLNWAVRDWRARRIFLLLLDDEINPDEAIVRFEPALNRALDLALGLKLVSWTEAKRLTLTERGEEVIAGIEAEGVLEEEREFLAQIPRPVSQVMIEKFLSRRS